jgi:hypothetical protein
MTDIHFGGVTIPSQQTLSPATAKNIAFRPACSQLIPVEIEGRIFWTVTMSDGDRIELAAYEPMSVQDAHFWLDAEGICKINGVEVPLVYVDQVPQRQVTQVTTTPELQAGEAGNQAGQSIQTVTPTQSSGLPNWVPIAIGAPLLLIIAAVFLRAVRGGGRHNGHPSKTAPKAKQGHDHASALNDIFGGGQR